MTVFLPGHLSTSNSPVKPKYTHMKTDLPVELNIKECTQAPLPNTLTHTRSCICMLIGEAEKEIVRFSFVPKPSKLV